jgi:hypothetical protein
MKTRIVPVILLSLVASLAFAAGDDSQGQNNQGQNAWGHDQWRDRGHDQWQDYARDPRVLAAPEIDPGQAVGALLLLSGALAVIRGYRRKK